MIQKLTLVAVAVCALAAAGCKPQATDFTSNEYKFKATFPGKPKEEQKTAAGIPFKMFGTETRNGACMVGVADMPIPAKEPPEMVQQRLDNARDGAIRNVGGTQKSSNPVTLAGKYPGREFTASITQPAKGLIRARVYLVWTRMYQVMVMGTDTYASSPEANAFLDSFKLIE